jgi:serine protease Do
MCTHRFLVALTAASISFCAFGLEPDQVYAKVAPSIVVVVGHSSSAPNDISFGSGVVIAPGQIITNCHVVEGSDVVYLKREKYSTIGIIRYADLERDLCQIGATDRAGFEKAVTLMEGSSGLRVGQKVYAIGAPQGLELTLSDGLIASLRNIPDVGTIIQTNAPISKGSSGGGLFDSNGRLIGITSFTFKTGQNLNFAVPAYWISELAGRHKLRAEIARKEIEATAAAQAQEEEAERREEQKKAELEQRRLQKEQRAAVEEQRREEEAKRRLAAEERANPGMREERKLREAEEARRRAEASARAAQQKLIDDLRARIQARIKNRVVIPSSMEGNPEARFEVVLLPGGEVLSATLEKSSGNPAYDAAVERAIVASQPLPVPTEVELFHEYVRYLTLVFRPGLEDSPISDTISVRAIGEPKVASPMASPASLSATDQAAIQRAYDNAYSNYRLSDYPNAVRGFEGFIKSYPNHPLTSNAHYWMGESYFHMRQYREAIEGERRFLGAYPDSAKAADALLIIGTAESSLGDNAAARRTFDELINKYPASDSADKAKGRMQRLR